MSFLMSFQVCVLHNFNLPLVPSLKGSNYLASSPGTRPCKGEWAGPRAGWCGAPHLARQPNDFQPATSFCLFVYLYLCFCVCVFLYLFICLFLIVYLRGCSSDRAAKLFPTWKSTNVANFKTLKREEIYLLLSLHGRIVLGWRGREILFLKKKKLQFFFHVSTDTSSSSFVFVYLCNCVIVYYSILL